MLSFLPINNKLLIFSIKSKKSKSTLTQTIVINLYQIPLLRPTISLIFGIALSKFFTLPIPTFYAFSFFLILALILHSLNTFCKNKFAYPLNIIFWLLPISLGISISEGMSHGNQLHAQDKLYSLVIVEEVEEKKKSIKVIARVLGQGSTVDSLTEENGNVLIYLERKNNYQPLELGDSLIFYSDLRQITGPKNPNGFDFKNFMSNKGIFHQTYLKKDAYEILPSKNKQDWKRWIAKRQRSLLEVFEKYLIEEENIAVAKAMILGNKENMTEELSHRFAVTGSMHILAVSGMHVGIVSMMILGFLNLFKTRKSQLKIFKGITSIFLIWLFALFTGAGPAVIRASMMFSLFFIAKFLLKRDVSVYNILCASAFIMLLSEPYQLFQLGFRLSFLAVISIVYFYPHLKKLLLTPYPILNTFTSCLNVSIAAQLLVFPISIYYFNMFSPAFLLTSLFVTFAATAILGLGLLLLAGQTLSLNDLCENLIAPLLEGSLEFLNQSLRFTENIQFLQFFECHLDSTQICILYFGILCFMVSISLKKKAYLIYSCSIFLSFFIYTEYQKSNTYSQSVAYIYHQKQQAYLEFYDRETCYTLGSIPEDNLFFKKELKKTRLIQHTKKKIEIKDSITSNAIEYAEPFLRIGDSLLAFAQAEKLKNYSFKKKIDFLLVNSEWDQLEKIEPQILNETTIVLDASLSYAREKKLRKWIAKEGLKSYNIKTNGAMLLEI